MSQSKSEYIVMLWPSQQDAAHLELYRQEICRGCDIARSLTWPAHLSLFYGIETDSPSRLVEEIGQIAAAHNAVTLLPRGLGTWNHSLIYLKIEPCPEIMQLQDSLRAMIKRLSEIRPALAGRAQREGRQLSPDEQKNVEQWGAIYPFRAHITLARQLSAEHCAQVMETARKLTSLAPRKITADRVSVEIFSPDADNESGASESLASFSLAPKTPDK